MMLHGRYVTGLCIAALFALTLSPRTAMGLALNFRSLTDPVPPGGILTYSIRVNSEGEGGDPTGAYCFNPDPECVTFPATCAIGSPSCQGNSFTGFVCVNAANAGQNCGVGDPPVPNAALCVALTEGTCTGGSNAGLPCSSSAQCPGETYICQHSFNDGAFCGSGNPLQPNPDFCLANPTGICSAGPNIGLPCTAPHGEPTEQCPPDEEEPGPTDTIVMLPIPSMTTFLDADSGGTSDGVNVTWGVPYVPCAGPNGQSGELPCPVVTARLRVDTEAPVGAVIYNQITALAPDGRLASRSTSTTVGTFRMVKFRLFYPKRSGNDRFIYKGFVTLPPGTQIDPVNEAVRIQLDNAATPIADVSLPPRSLQTLKQGNYRFRTRGSGINRLLIREAAPSFYRIIVRAGKMTLPLPQQDIFFTVTFGDDSMTHPIYLISTSNGRKYIGQQ